MASRGWTPLAASTSYVSFALWLALFQLALQLPLFTLLSQIALTIAYSSILVYHLSDKACLERIQRFAARLIGQIPKFGQLAGYMLKVLRWLPVRQRIEYRVASFVWRFQLDIAPIYLTDLCRSVSGIASGCSLRSAGRGSSQSRLLVPLSCKPALFVLMARQCGTASLLSGASYLGRFPTHSIIVLKLLILNVLKSGGSASE